MSKDAEDSVPLALTAEQIARGFRLCTVEEMKRMPPIFQNLGICNAAGELLVSTDADVAPMPKDEKHD